MEVEFVAKVMNEVIKSWIGEEFDWGNRGKQQMDKVRIYLKSGSCFWTVSSIRVNNCAVACTLSYPRNVKN